MSKITIINYGDQTKLGKDIALKVVTELGAKIASDAKQLAPVDTGNLRGSIGYKTAQTQTANPEIQDNVKDEYEGYVGSYLNYPVYVEYGTFKMAAQPFLGPAVELSKGASAESVLKKISDEQLKKTFAGRKIKETFNI